MSTSTLTAPTTQRCYACNGTGRATYGQAICGVCKGLRFVPMQSRVPITHRADPATSAMAEREITASGERDAQQRAVYAAVCAHPGRTASELAELLGTLDRYQVGRRLPEMAEALDGAAPRVVLIERGRVRRCEITGRACVTWQPLGWRERGEGGQ